MKQDGAVDAAIAAQNLFADLSNAQGPKHAFNPHSPSNPLILLS
jgi:hypothetical protein